ncbi:MAG: hypothetical protein OXN27_14905 [Candidatus Poribacteria bacterium]|nr:hypothetical protein [Candidatus Poribacteria bacterium]
MFLQELMKYAYSQEIRNLGISLFNRGKYPDALVKNEGDMKTRQYCGMCKCPLASENLENTQQIQETISDFKTVLDQMDYMSQITQQTFQTR